MGGSNDDYRGAYMPFFTYSQNNSGGGFDYDHERGISQVVIVEADDALHANTVAESIGLYFDGEGDCPCCGDRWSESWRSDGDKVPSRYGTPISEAFETFGTPPEGTAAGYVHYRNGEVKGF